MTAGLLLGLWTLWACHRDGAPGTDSQPAVGTAAPGQREQAAPSLSAVGGGRPAAPALQHRREHPVVALLDRLPAACPADAAAGCVDAWAGTLFEIAALVSSGEGGPVIDAADPQPGQRAAVARRIVAAMGQGLDAEAGHVRNTALAAIAALSCMTPGLHPMLIASPLWTSLRRVAGEGPSALARGRALLALGALYPAVTGTAEKEAVRAVLRTGLLQDHRYIARMAVLGTTLAREEALDGPMLEALHRALGNAPRAATEPPALPTIPASLPPQVAVDVMPLLSAYVDLLRSLPEGQGTAAAQRLVDVALRHDPRSATAHFLRAQLLDARRDAGALPALRTALGLGNLPSTFSDTLGEGAATLTPPVDIAAARAQVRARLAARPALRGAEGDVASRLTRADLEGLHPPHIRSVNPSDLQARAEAHLAHAAADSPAGLVLGAELFHDYPFASQDYYDTCLRSFLQREGGNHDLLDPLGLQVAMDDGGKRSVLGLVSVASPSQAKYGVTCALCHTQVDARGRRIDGLPSRTYDQGLLLAACIDQPIHHKAQNRNIDQLMEYLPGRNDSSSDGIHNPTEIPSFFGLAARGPVRWNGDTPSLEVQIDRNLSQQPAPPAVIALLAAYLRSLSPPPSVDPAPAVIHRRGAALFSTHCARCHEPPLYTSGRIVPIDVLGTDGTRVSAVLPNSTDGYKIPSLRAVARTAPYLHDGGVATLESLLDRRRVGGHRFGQDLPAPDRAALVSFVRSL